MVWLCWEHLSFPMRLDMPIMSGHRGMLLYQATAPLQGPKISAGMKPPGKATREQGETETSTKLPLPLSPHPPTCQSFVLNQLQRRGASVPCRGCGGTFLDPGPLLVPGCCCSPQQTFEALAQSSLQTICFTGYSTVFPKHSYSAPFQPFPAEYFYAAKFLCSTKLYPAEGIFVTNTLGSSFPSLSLCDLQFLFLIPVQRRHKCLSFLFPPKTCVVQRHDLDACFCKQRWPQCYTKIHVTESACSSLS